jgi:predicted MFS family arabinose efflux permease
MDWTTLLAIGLFVFAWLTAIYQSQKDDWNTSRTVGMFVFLAGATCGVFLDNFLSTESSLLPWIEPIAALIMLIGLFIAWIWKPEEDNS